MKLNQEQAFKSYLAAASYAAERRDFGNMFSCLSLAMTILEAEGFETRYLLPSNRASFSAFMGALGKHITSDQVDVEALRQLQEAASKPETIEYP